MHEIELKFQVPAAASAAVRAAVWAPDASSTALRALYVDTPSLALARAGLALRLRQEGERWVQTLKGRGDGLMQRLEHELPLPQEAAPPQLDPTRHAGTPAGDALQAALMAAGEDPQALRPLYRTEIQRLHRRVAHQGAVVELAHDTGWLLAGDSAAPRELAVDELELELLVGSPAALLSLACDWVQEHGLWWDCRTKSERGTRLALGMTQVAPTLAGAELPVGTGPARSVQAALAHALPNWAELASGLGGDAHRGQLRLALGRLAAALGDWEPGALQATAQALAAAWRELAQAAGDPACDALDAAALTSRPLQRLLLQTLALAQPPG